MRGLRHLARRLRRIVPVRVANAVVNHPPRLKKIRLTSTFGDTRYSRSLRAFYSSYPDVRVHDIQTNRALFAKGALKFALGLTPLGLPTFVAHALLKRRDVKRRLEAADVDFRAAVRDAVMYGLLQPVDDVLRALPSVQSTGF